MEGLLMPGLSMDGFNVTQRAREMGFQDCHIFRPELPGKVCMLLGLAVHCHSSMCCARISAWLEETWKQHLVASIVSALPTNQADVESLYQHPELWESLSTAVLSFAITVCAHYNRHDLAEKLTSQGDIDLNDEEVLQLVCHQMCFDLFILRQSERGFVQTVIRDEEHRGLPVVVAEEQGTVMLLYHKDLTAVRSLDSEGFPFYCEVPKQNMWTDYFVLVPPDLKTALEKTNEMVANALQFISVLISNGVSPSLLPYFQHFKQNCLLYESYSVPSGLHDPTLFAAFHDELPVASPLPVVNEEHSVQDCGHYSRDSRYYTLAECQHMFHEDCLLKHLQVECSLVPQTNRGSLTCPVCRHPISLVDVNQLSPDLSGFVTHIPEEGAPTQLPFEPRSPEEFNSVCHHCSKCLNPINLKYSFTHQNVDDQHIVCLDCLRSQMCPACEGVIDNESWTWVQQAKMFYEMMRKSMQI